MAWAMPQQPGQRPSMQASAYHGLGNAPAAGAMPQHAIKYHIHFSDIAAVCRIQSTTSHVMAGSLTLMCVGPGLSLLWMDQRCAKNSFGCQ